MTSFSTATISIDENGIDLLRNRFAYQHLNFSEVQHFSIEDGYLLKNRLVILIAGVALIALAIKLFGPVLEVYSEVPENLSTHDMGRGLAFMQMIPLALIGFGGIFRFNHFANQKYCTSKSGQNNSTSVSARLIKQVN